MKWDIVAVVGCFFMGLVSGLIVANDFNKTATRVDPFDLFPAFIEEKSETSPLTCAMDHTHRPLVLAWVTKDHPREAQLICLDCGFRRFITDENVEAVRQAMIAMRDTR